MAASTGILAAVDGPDEDAGAPVARPMPNERSLSSDDLARLADLVSDRLRGETPVVVDPYDERELGISPFLRRRIGGAYGGSSPARPITGNSLRAVLTLLLTFSIVIVVIVGLIARLPPGDFAQYVSPLTGLAGLALGYWFGSERRT